METTNNHIQFVPRRQFVLRYNLSQCWQARMLDLGGITTVPPLILQVYYTSSILYPLYSYTLYYYTPLHFFYVIFFI